MKSVKVSVVVLVYNHERYLKKCLDSILGQITDFDFEIIVHDDASIDDSSKIILDYTKRFPKKVIPVIQTCNRYQAGIDIRKLIAPYIKGDYVALCEGDDWWTDNSKLQTQYDYATSHPSCSLCVHAVDVYNSLGSEIVGHLSPSEVSREFNIDDILFGGGGLFGTNSMFFPAAYYLRPEIYNNWGVGDFPSLLYLASKGEVHYLPESMAAYRSNATGSWSERMQSPDYAITIYKAIADGLNRFDEATKYEFTNRVQTVVNSYIFEIAVLESDFRKCFCSPLVQVYRKMTTRDKLRTIVRMAFPSLYRRLKNRKMNV